MNNKIEEANEILDSVGARTKKNNNAKPTDKITLEISRDEAIGLAFIQLKHYLACDFHTFQILAEFALNRSVWTHEFADPEVKAELERLWQSAMDRQRKK